MKLSRATLEELGRSQALKIIATTDLTPLKESRKSLKLWQDNGLAADMGYMLRDPALLSDAKNLLPQAKSVLLFSVFYERAKSEALPKGKGRVARYAFGRDYHSVLKSRLKAFVLATEERLGKKIRARVFSDAVPLLERALAARAGLGFIGKNTMLIRPKSGSFSFISEIVWDVEVEEISEPVRGGCGSCNRCQTACPTNALSSAYVLDARKCISYLSIEKRAPLLNWERKALGEWIYGCDICQEVCPYNHRALKYSIPSDLKEFSRFEGPGPFLDLKEILSLKSEADFKSRFGSSALTRAGRDSLVRNAVCVALNTGCSELFSELVRLAGEDPSEMVRAASLWAISEFSLLDGTLMQTQVKSALDYSLKNDASKLVQAEIKEIFERGIIC